MCIRDSYIPFILITLLKPLKTPYFKTFKTPYFTSDITLTIATRNESPFTTYTNIAYLATSISIPKAKARAKAKAKAVKASVAVFV